MAYTDAGGAFGTLIEAVDEVLPPTTIRVCPGTFVVEYTSIYGRDVEDEVVVSGSDEGSTLSGGSANSVLGVYSPGARVTLNGLRVRQGYEDEMEFCGDLKSPFPCPRTTAGTGVVVANIEATGDTLAIDENQAQFGAGIQVYKGTLTLRDSGVANNHAAIAGGAAVIQEGGVLISENTLWEGNTPDDIIFATLADDPDDVVVHATWNVDGRTDFTCRFETFTCE
jgi:hypothetical protein